MENNILCPSQTAAEVGLAGRPFKVVSNF